MTRAEFEAFMDAEGWTEVQRDLWAGFTPLGTVDDFRREQFRPDGMINVSLVKRPRFERMERAYAEYRRVGLSVVEAIRGAWAVARP